MYVRLALCLLVMAAPCAHAEISAAEVCVQNYQAWFDRMGAKSPHFELLESIRTGFLRPRASLPSPLLNAQIDEQTERNVADTYPGNISGFHWGVARRCMDIANAVNPKILPDDEMASQLNDGVVGLEMQGMRPYATAHYTYASASSADGKTLLFSEINHRHLVSIYNDGGTVTRRDLVSGIDGLYGVAMDPRLGLRGIYIGLARGDDEVTKTCPDCGVAKLNIDDGSFQYVLGKGLRSPRTLFVDENGVLYAVFDEGHQIRSWDPRTGQEKLVFQGADQLQRHPQSAIARGGVVYWSEYGTQRPGGDGRLLAPGRVCSTAWKKCAEGFWRGRGLAFLGKNKLLLGTEANRWDQGNSGSLYEIDLTKVDESAANPFANAVRLVATGLDYPNYFSSFGNRVYIPLTRENLMMVYDADAPFRVQRGLARNDSRVAITERGDAGPSPAAIQITVNGHPFQASLGTQTTGGNSGWMNIPAGLVGGSRVEMPYRNNPETPCPGVFQLPTLVCSAYSGARKVPCSAVIIPRRFPGGSRWPMQYPERTPKKTGPEYSAPGFTEFPISYSVFYSF